MRSFCHPGCDHNAPVDSTQKARLLWIALALIGGFSAIELAVSWSSHSLALLAEAGHLLSDCGALGVAILATWLARLPASSQAPFGYRRVEVLAALANGIGLIAIALWVGWEALTRLQTSSEEVLGLPMLVTAALGLGVNLLNATLLHPHSHHDLNLKGAFLHMVADALSSVGVILAAIAVWAFHWNWADGAVSVLVAVLIVLGAVPLVWQSTAILLEKAPDYVDSEAIAAHLMEFEGIEAIDDLRVWAIAPGQEMLVAQVTVNLKEGGSRDRLLSNLQMSLQNTFGIRDVTIQMSAPPAFKPISLSIPPSIELVIGAQTENQLP